MTDTPKPSELAEKWRKPVGSSPIGPLLEAGISAAQACADSLEASLAAHPMVPVAELLETHTLGGTTYQTCKIKLCFFVEGHPDRDYTDSPHADWCPVVGKAVAT